LHLVGLLYIIVRKVRDGIPGGKRNRGRPMKRWRDALE